MNWPIHKRKIVLYLVEPELRPQMEILGYSSGPHTHVLTWCGFILSAGLSTPESFSWSKTDCTECKAAFLASNPLPWRVDAMKRAKQLTA